MDQRLLPQRKNCVGILLAEMEPELWKRSILRHKLTDFN
jgi:hypothetical protein